MTACNVLVVGRSGQLARAIAGLAPSSFIFKGGLDHDFFDVDETRRLIDKLDIGTLINTAAYTAVDQAEREKEAAFRLNQGLPMNLANACSSSGCRLIHISTDYVFDGDRPRGETYFPEDTPNPINIYGESKLAGEEEVCKHGPQQTKIIRTSWLHSSIGKNFQTTMERLMRERDELRIVNDQWGTPTNAIDLAKHLIQLSINGGWTDNTLHHFRSRPAMTWFDLACLIRRQLQNMGETPGEIIPIPSDEYPTTAKRGKNTSLSPWQD